MVLLLWADCISFQQKHTLRAVSASPLLQTSYWILLIDCGLMNLPPQPRGPYYIILHLASDRYDTVVLGEWPSMPIVEPLVRFELTTCWLQISCATIAPQGQVGAPSGTRTRGTRIKGPLLYHLSQGRIWCWWMDSDHRPPRYQHGALTDWATPANWHSGEDLNPQHLDPWSSALSNWATRVKIRWNSKHRKSGSKNRVNKLFHLKNYKTH